MLPTLAVRLRLGTLLAQDSTTLAQANTTVALVQQPFTPNENLVPGNLTLANFTSSAPITVGTGNQAVAIDPATLNQLITLNDPVGGFRWVSGDSANLPQTIYGWAHLNANQTVLLGMGVLNQPVTLQASGQQVDLGSLTYTLNSQPIT